MFSATRFSATRFSATRPSAVRFRPLVVLAFLLLVACGGEDEGVAESSAGELATDGTDVATDATTAEGEGADLGDENAGGDESTSTTADGEPASSTSSSSSSTTTPADDEPDACPAGSAVPGDASGSTAIVADLDLDGFDDDVSTYFAPGDGRWRIRVEWAGGGATDQPITDSSGPGTARPIGVHDVEGDGTPELFVTVGSGASARLVGLFDIVPCALTRVTLGGEPASFPVGATVQNISGLSCGPVGDLDRQFAQYVADDAFEGGFEPFALDGAVLTGGPGDGATFTAEEAAALASFDCGALTL